MDFRAWSILSLALKDSYEAGKTTLDDYNYALNVLGPNPLPN